MEPKDHVLLVDDDPAFVRGLQILLEDEGGLEVSVAHSGSEALAVVARDAAIRVVVCDLSMPGMSGLDVLREVRQRWSEIAVIMMTAHSSVRTAVEAMQLGAQQYLAKPVDPDELLIQVQRALQMARLERENAALRERVGDPSRFDLLVGGSPAMQQLREVISRLAEVDSTVLIRGETGTGKELVARLVHRSGPRRAEPFVVVNCTAIPGELLESELFGHEKGAFTGAADARIGRIEQASGGTLLLDEVGDMPPQLQPKLLRFLQERVVQRIGASQERRVDVRVMAATHRDLEAAIASGEFRADLYHRLSTIPLTVPALRERLEDLPELVTHLLVKIAHRLGRSAPPVDRSVVEDLARRPFQGNVRELENLLERAMVLGDGLRGEVLTASDFSVDSTTGETTGMHWDSIPLEGGFPTLQDVHRRGERRLIERALNSWPELSNGEIAARLGTNRRVLELRMKEYGLTK